MVTISPGLLSGRMKRLCVPILLAHMEQKGLGWFCQARLMQKAFFMGTYPEFIQRLDLFAQNMARLMIEKAVNINSNYSIAQLNLGILYLHEKAYDKAQEHLRKAIEINSRCSAAHFNLGLTLLFKAKIGDFKQAEIELDEAIRLGYKKGNDVFFVAQLLLTTRSYEAAKKWFKIAYDIYYDAGNKELFLRQFGQMLEKIKDVEVQKQGKVILESL